MSARDALRSLQQTIRAERGINTGLEAGLNLALQDLPFTAARRPRPEPIHIIAGQDHPELPAERLTGRRANFVALGEGETFKPIAPRDYAEPEDEDLPAAARPMFDTLSRILLGSILTLGGLAFWFGFAGGA